MGEETIYNISINTIKEMEKRDWIGILKAKRLSLHTLGLASLGLLLIALLWFLGYDLYQTGAIQNA